MSDGHIARSSSRSQSSLSNESEVQRIREMEGIPGLEDAGDGASHPTPPSYGYGNGSYSYHPTANNGHADYSYDYGLSNNVTSIYDPKYFFGSNNNSDSNRAAGSSGNRGSSSGSGQNAYNFGFSDFKDYNTYMQMTRANGHSN